MPSSLFIRRYARYLPFSAPYIDLFHALSNLLPFQICQQAFKGFASYPFALWLFLLINFVRHTSALIAPPQRDLQLNPSFPISFDPQYSGSGDTHFGFLLSNLLLMMRSPQLLRPDLISKHFMPIAQFSACTRSAVPAAAAGSPPVFDI